MFRRVRTLSGRSVSGSSNSPTTEPSKNKSSLRRRLTRGAQDQQSYANDDHSVQTTITVQTTRTTDNENRKPTAAGMRGSSSSQVFVNQTNPVQQLEQARKDITKSSIYLKDIPITKQVAASFLALIRGDNRSWEAIAVDILRQKARWESITIEDCSQEYLDMIISFILNIDNCTFLHLSNLVFTSQAAWALQSLSFTHSLTKLQLDLIDLTPYIPMLNKGFEGNKSLKSIIASRCGLNDEKLGELLKTLPPECEELRIFGNKCRAKGLAAIASFLQKNNSLKILDLSYQHVEEGANFDISLLATSLLSNTSLKSLDMDNDSINDQQLGKLINALCQNTTLEEVMLNHNKISGAGIAVLAANFLEMKGLKKISMYSNLFEAPASAPAPVPPRAVPSSTLEQRLSGAREVNASDKQKIEEEEESTVYDEETYYGSDKKEEEEGKKKEEADEDSGDNNNDEEANDENVNGSENSDGTG